MRLHQSISLVPRAKILRQFAGFQLSAFVKDGPAAAAIGEKASAHAGNALYHLVSRQITLLEFAAGIKGHHRAFSRAEPTSARAGHVQNRRVVAHLNNIRSAVWMETN